MVDAPGSKLHWISFFPLCAPRKSLGLQGTIYACLTRIPILNHVLEKLAGSSGSRPKRGALTSGVRGLRDPANCCLCRLHIDPVRNGAFFAGSLKQKLHDDERHYDASFEIG